MLRDNLSQVRGAVEKAPPRLAGVVIAVALAFPAAAQDINMTGVARSVTLMRYIGSHCPDASADAARRYEAAFLDVGHSAYNPRAFDAAVAAEMPRRAAEVKAAGAAAWCATERAQMAKAGDKQLFPAH